MRAMVNLPNRRLVRATLGMAALVALLGSQQELARLVPGRYAPAVRVGVLAAAALVGAFAIRNGVGALTHGLDRQATVTIRNLSTWTLYVLLGIGMISAAGVDLSGLLLGGAILGVIVASASQASLGNFFAGLVLMLGRPYRVGAAVRMRGPSLGALEYEGTIVDMGALYTTLTTAGGEVLKLPNSSIVTSALLLGEAPLQAEIELALPPGTPLRPIEAALRERLGAAAGTVTIRPRVLEAGKDGKLACQVQVRSTEHVEPAALAEALALAITAATSDGQPPATATDGQTPAPTDKTPESP
jgi:small-conductance mechanosensitive channel